MNLLVSEECGRILFERRDRMELTKSTGITTGVGLKGGGGLGGRGRGEGSGRADKKGGKEELHCWNVGLRVCKVVLE